MTTNEAQSSMTTGRSRRAHEKSRYGCKNCKVRRIKCDESRPSCENCIRRKKICDFQSSSIVLITAPLPKVAIGRPQRNSTVSPPAADSRDLLKEHLSPTMIEYLYPGQDPNARLFESRLFHYFTTRSPVFPWPSCGPGAFAPEGQLLAANIPVLALRSDIMMFLLLSLASFSLGMSDSSNKHMQVAAFSYMGRALAKFQNALASDPDDQDVDVMYASSRLIGFFTLCQHLTMPQQVIAKRRVLDWLNVFRGLRALNRHPAKNNSLFASAQVGNWDYPYAQTDDLSPSLLQPFDFLLHDSPSGVSANEATAYCHIVAYLASIHNLRALSREQMWWFLVENRSDFLAYCAQERSKAWLLLGVYLHFAAVVNEGRPLGYIASLDIRLVKHGLSAEDISLLDRAGVMIRTRFAGARDLVNEPERVELVTNNLNRLAAPQSSSKALNLPDLPATLWPTIEV